jgi:hypothetical protein
MITEILAFVHPEECGLWNKKARGALNLLGFEETIHDFKHAQIIGKDYVEFNLLLKEIQKELITHDIQDLDFLGIDYFLFEVWKQGVEFTEPPENNGLIKLTKEGSDFDHDEIIEHLLALGVSLGFDVEKEKPIAAGARVDALWKAKIANLGVVIYVFEVQKRGSHDSLILNLQRAQKNHSVQRLVVVASLEDITKIRREVSTLPESFKQFISYMEVSDVNRAYELMGEVTEIIDKLELAKNEFGIEANTK